MRKSTFTVKLKCIEFKIESNNLKRNEMKEQKKKEDETNENENEIIKVNQIFN